MFYTNSEHVPTEVHSALESMRDCTGMKVAEMMAKLVKSLDKATAGTRLNPVDIDEPDPMFIDSDDEGTFNSHLSFSRQLFLSLLTLYLIRLAFVYSHCL